jgi:4-hydroxy-2-oxoheptanedioate aldolase
LTAEGGGIAAPLAVLMWFTHPVGLVKVHGSQPKGFATMELPKNAFKAAIARMELQRGVWCTIADTQVAEILAGAGFDWLMFDTEHSGMDENTIIPLLQAAAVYPVSPMVRPKSHDPAGIKKLLDAGAQTILVPYVQTAQEATLVAASVAYPPVGIRGVAGATRASRYGKVTDYHKRARDEICLIVQVETAATLPEIEAIAAVDGVDAMFVGPADLAASMGFPGQPSHPDVRAAVIDAIRRIRAAGLPAGLMTMDLSFYDDAIAAGAVFIVKDIDTVAMLKGLSSA